MKTIIFATICVFTLAGFAAAQNKSVYTSTKTSACRTIKSSTQGAGYYVGECPGVGGYKFQLIEDDIRQTIDIITPAKKKFELNFWSYFSRFSAVGEKVEWRTKNGVPVALIARFNVSNADDETKSDSYLMVSKISKTQSCVVDIIYPSADQNEKARKSADGALKMPCKVQE